MGFLINLANPKAYAAMLAVLTQFAVTQQPSLMHSAWLVAMLVLVVFLVDTVWLCVGGYSKQLFYRPHRRKILIRVLAMLLVLTTLSNYLLFLRSTV